jgi:hypothetical protein
VVSHGGTIIHGLIPIMFNVCYTEVKKNPGYGTNCHLTYIQYHKNNKFLLLMPPTNRHLQLYDDFIKYIETNKLSKQNIQQNRQQTIEYDDNFYL